MSNLQEERKQFNSLGLIYPAHNNVSVEPETLGGVSTYWFTPQAVTGEEIVIYFHGGGFIYGSIATHRAMVSHIANAIGRKMLLIDYALAPEHPYPAALNDGVAVIKALLQKNPGVSFGIMGDSAGGNLTMSTVLKLKALKMPASLYQVLISPWLNADPIYPSYAQNEKRDPIITKEFIAYAAALYTAGHDAKDPLVSPVYGDLKDVNPTLILVGEQEVLRDDALVMHETLRQAGALTKLKVYDDVTHVWTLTDIDSTHSREALREMANFVAVHQTSAVG